MKPQAPETTFERREIKYLLTTAQKEAFMGIIEGYLRPDENGNSGSYRLMSLYFDSPNKDFYRAKWFNLPSRKKVRIRKYHNPEEKASGAEEQVFIEIKEHTPTINYKRRILLPVGQAFSILNGNMIEQALAPEDQAILDEIGGLVKEFQLQPTAIVSYHRQAYKVKKEDWGLRITFDQNIRFRTDELSLERGDQDKRLIDEGMEIMEIKVKGTLPSWTQEALERCGIEQLSFSKYSHTIEKSFEWMLVPPYGLEDYENILKEAKEASLPLELWKQRTAFLAD